MNLNLPGSSLSGSLTAAARWGWYIAHFWNRLTNHD
jgi:hypothetical protein